VERLATLAVHQHERPSHLGVAQGLGVTDP
jgi:hypothetical protein